MAQKRVTLSKDGREISLALPQDIVEYKAAGWRESKAERPAPVAAPADRGAVKPAEPTASKGGATK